jgi:very-short-patch-repair endonuclease
VDYCSAAPGASATLAFVDESPDSDWYLDHVVVPAGPDGDWVGPIRAWQASWVARAERLRADAVDTARGRAIRRALGQGFVLTRAQARAAGLADAEVRRLIRAGTWSAPHRGVVAVMGLVDKDRHTLAATAAALLRGGCVSGWSAAMLHGLPLIHELAAVVLTAAAPARMGARAGILVRSAALPATHVTTWHGVSITTVARTVVDLARADRAAGLVAADAVLRERVVGPNELARVIEQISGWPGARAGRDVVELASPLAESPLESLTRLAVIDAGLPSPELQARVGRYRVDFLWRAERVIVEADGRVKYDRDELWREKVRQESLERLGFRVVRVLWDDITLRPAETIQRIRRALGRAPRPS